MHILFDSLSSQVQVHRRLNIRMNTLLGAIQSERWTHSFSQGPITKSSGQLDGCDVLAILTREQLSFDGYFTNPIESKAFAYTDEEIDAMQSFVKNGGGLLLISNHGPYNPDNNPPNDGALGDTQYDVKLAEAFGVVINPAHFNDKDGNTLLQMTNENNSLNPGLESGILFQVSKIAVHNSCGIQGKKSTPWTSIAKIPDDAKDNSGYKIKSHDPKANQQQHYAIRLDNSRVIVAGNSGLAGDDGCTIPAPGTILYGNNLLFLLNCFKYLGGIPLGF